MKKLSLVYILFILFSLSCGKDEPALTGPITFEFDNRLEDHEGATITYDITDIKVKRDDGLVFHDRQAHHVDASNEASQEISLQGLTSGGYVEVTFAVESIRVSGPVAFQNDSVSVTLQMPRTPVRPEHEPEVHLIFNIDKLTSGVQEAFVVDHVHEN